MITLTSQTQGWALEVEGLGFVSGGTAYTYLLTDHPAGAWDANSRAVQVLGELPSPTLRADFRAGAGQGGEVRAKLVLPRGTTTDLIRKALVRPRPRQVATLQAAIDRIDTTLDLGESALDGLILYMGREAILIGTETGVGTGIYSGCTRGRLETNTQVHGVGAGFIDDVWDVLWPIQARRVTLYLIPGGAASYGDLVPVLALSLRDVERDGGRDLALVLESPLALLRTRKLLPHPWRARLEGTNIPTGGESAAELVRLIGNGLGRPTAYFRAAPPPGYTQARYPWNITSPTAGDQILVWWEEGIRTLTYDSGDEAEQLWTLDMANPGGGQFGGPPLDVERALRGELEAECRQVFVADPSAPEASRLGGVRPSFGGIAYELLTSAWAGASLPGALFDAESFTRADEELGALASVQRFFVGTQDDAGSLLDLVQQKLLAPIQAALVPGPTGLALRRLRDSDAPGAASLDVDEGDTLGKGFAESGGVARIVDAVQWSFDADPEGTTTPLTLYDAEQQALHLGSDRVSSVDGGAVADEGQSFALAQAYALRFGAAMPEVRFTLPAHARLLLPGDPLYLSSDGGLVGLAPITGEVTDEVEDARAVVVGVRWRLDDGTQEVEAWRTDLAYDTRRKVAPALSCTGTLGGAGVINVGERVFVVADQPVGTLTRDTDALVVGDKLALVTRFGGARVTGLVVTAKSNTTVTVTGLGATTPSSTDLLITDIYDRQTTAQRAAWASIGDASGEVPTAGDLAPQYEGL